MSFDEDIASQTTAPVVDATPRKLTAAEILRAEIAAIAAKATDADRHLVKQVASPSVSVSIMSINPNAAALLWTEHNIHNRPFSEVTARGYAAAMKRGEWELTNQGIAFDQNGIVIDGQHRLAASAISGVPLYVEVSCGRKPSIIKKIDAGKRRFAHESLALLGIENAKIKTSIAKHAEDYAGRAGDDKAEALLSMELEEAYVVANDDKLDWALRMAHATAVNVAEPSMTEALAATIAYVMDKGNWPRHVIPAFLAAVQQGVDTKDNGVILPTARILMSAKRNDTKKDALTRNDQIATVLKAARHWIRGETVAKFKPHRIVGSVHPVPLRAEPEIVAAANNVPGAAE